MVVPSRPGHCDGRAFMIDDRAPVRPWSSLEAFVARSWRVRGPFMARSWSVIRDHGQRSSSGSSPEAFMAYDPVRSSIAYLGIRGSQVTKATTTHP